MNTPAEAVIEQGDPLRQLARVATDVVRLTKPRITLMVVITGSAGMWLAASLTNTPLVWSRAVVILLGLAMVVASANALNMVFERDRDAQMGRTKDRPLPSGRLSPIVALAFAGSWAAFSLPLLLSGGWVSAALAVLALVLYAGVYTPLKGVTPLALLVGAVPGALPPLIGWAAVSGGIELPGLVLFGVLFFWQLPHFLAIASFRGNEYARAGIRVTPLVRGERATRWMSLGYSIALLATSLALVPLGVAGWLYPTVASLLGLGLVGIAIGALLPLSRQPEAGDRWPRRMFVATLVYLPLWMAAMMVAA